MHYELTGSGEPMLLLHPGFADSRYWQPQWETLGVAHRLVRVDLAGFGESPIERLPVAYARDVIVLLDELGLRPAVIVGASLGGRVALEIAIERPDLVRALVLVGATLPETLASSEEMRGYAAELFDALGRGDLAAAIEASVRTWVDGPTRAPDQVDPTVRELVATMQRRVFELGREQAGRFVEEPLVPDLARRLHEVVVPTLIVSGALDMDRVGAQAASLAREIPGAVSGVVDAAGHAASLERPVQFASLLEPFLETLH
jgi:3-oxoadipate enol-lactonase